MYTEEEKIRAAYALNLWTVSISQIVDYNDSYILEQEYSTIMNNLNLENMPKDEALKDVINEILDQIVELRMDDEDRKMVEREYQHQIKNAIWSAVPNMGAIFATRDPVAMGIALATQVGTGYMNYRRNKAERELEHEKSKWQIQKNRMRHLHGLQKQLFATAWQLADTYNFDDKYRLTEKQISEYNQALMEANPVKRYNKLAAMEEIFNAYPVFWYQIGSTANIIYRKSTDAEIRDKYKSCAIEKFEKYRSLNKFNLLRSDALTSAWALEYLELKDMDQPNAVAEAKDLIKIAEEYSKNALDIIELCAFAWLRISDDDNAIRLFHRLVNEGYNANINTQILSGLYIKKMRSEIPEKAKAARVDYRMLFEIIDQKDQKYILEIPDEHIDLAEWKPAWNQDETFDELVEREKEEKQKEQEQKEETRKKARVFYQKPIKLISTKQTEAVAEYFLGVLTEYRNRLGDDRLPMPSHCKMKEYLSGSKTNSEAKREEFEASGSHVIMIGDSSEAEKLYKTAKNGRWDYYHLGMRYISYGNKTVLLTRKLKDEDINKLVELAREVSENHPMPIPPNVKSVEYTWLKDNFKGALDSPEETVAHIVAGIVGAPILALGQVLENIENTIQWSQNKGAAKKLEFLQYCVILVEKFGLK